MKANLEDWIRDELQVFGAAYLLEDKKKVEETTKRIVVLVCSKEKKVKVVGAG